MIYTERMNELYGVIAEQLNDIIPDGWEKIYLYSEILDDSREVYFYFESTSKNEIVFSHNIPQTYKLSGKIYDSLLQEIIESMVELNNEFKNKNGNTWTNLTFILEKTGKFNVKYHYNDTLNSKFTMMERQVIFEYEVVGLEQEGEDQEVIDRYLESDEYKMYLTD